MKSKIIFLFSLILLSMKSSALTWDEMIIPWLTFNASDAIESYADDYMRIYRNPVWRKNHNDEFSMIEKREDTVKIIQEKIDQVKNGAEYQLTTYVHLEDYDFDGEFYPIRTFGEEVFFDIGGAPYNRGKFPLFIKIWFSVPESMKKIPMSREDARSFYVKESKKEGYFNRNRGFEATIEFKPIESKKDGALVIAPTKFSVYHRDDKNLVFYEKNYDRVGK